MIIALVYLVSFVWFICACENAPYEPEGVRWG